MQRTRGPVPGRSVPKPKIASGGAPEAGAQRGAAGLGRLLCHDGTNLEKRKANRGKADHIPVHSGSRQLISDGGEAGQEGWENGRTSDHGYGQRRSNFTVETLEI